MLAIKNRKTKEYVAWYHVYTSKLESAKLFSSTEEVREAMAGYNILASFHNDYEYLDVVSVEVSETFVL